MLYLASVPVRSRINRLIATWASAALAEALLWWFFVRNSYFRELFMPITVVVLILAIAISWRLMRVREAQRRGADRRHEDRRE